MWSCQQTLPCIYKSFDMELKLLPEDLCIEDLMMYLPENSYKIFLRGTHKRNAYRDIMAVDTDKDGKLLIQVGRNSLYDTMPEYLFHPINRYDNIPEIERRERYQEEHYKQEKEKADAYAFFACFDNFLISLRTEVKKTIAEYASENTILQNIIGDTISPAQRENPFIRRCLAFLPKCRSIRGNRTLLTLMIKKILREENIVLELNKQSHTFRHSELRYDDSIDSVLDDIYLGDEYDEVVTTYDIHFWPEDHCGSNFQKIIDDIEEFREFIQDYFMSIEEIIRFNIVKDESSLVLSDENTYNYLNYNTNI